MLSRLTVLALALAVALPLAGCLSGKDKGGKDDDLGAKDCPAIAYADGSSPCSGGIEPAPGGLVDPAGPYPVPAALPWYPSDGASERTTFEVPSGDGHPVPVTLYKPKVASATQQVPMLLHSHGFTGKRANTDDAFQAHVAAGFGVLSFDERGHGDAKDDSEVYFMHPDYEVQDVIAIIDYVAGLDWVLKESPVTAVGPNDPVLGTMGGSYGGAYQLMGAIFDARIDATVPEITWNDITEALAPGGAVKSGWVDLFYIAGNVQQSVTFSNDFHLGFAWATATNTFPAGQTPLTPDLYTRLKESSPVSYPGKLRVPTLLIQGMPDTLFPLNQAVANLRALEAFGVPSALYTHLGGHILNTGSLGIPSPIPIGLQGVPGGKPCGTLADLQIAWHQTYLLGLGNWTGHPRVCLALEDETTVVGQTFPLEGTIVREVPVPGPTPVVQAAVGPAISVNVITADAETIVAGIPRLSGTIMAAGADSIVYFSLQRLDPTLGFEAIVDDQVMPLRLVAPVTSATSFSLELGGVATRLAPGESLVLMVSTVTPMFAGNAERLPGAVLFGDLKLELPTLPADTPGIAA